MNIEQGTNPIFLFLYVSIMVVYLLRYISHKQNNAKRRQPHRDALLEFVITSDFIFSKEKSESIISRYSQTKLITKSSEDREVSHLISGKMNDRDIRLFDLKYSVSNGKTRVVYEYSAAAIEFPTIFSDLYISSENILNKMAGLAGFDDINFESEEFNKAFYVKSSNKKFAYDIINSSIMQLLLANKKWTIEFNSNVILIYKKGVFINGEYDQAIEFFTNFIDLIPEYIICENLNSQ